ncbi:hypothetical protein OXX79_010429 [Metschnikowia pulcherrima]
MNTGGADSTGMSETPGSLFTPQRRSSQIERSSNRVENGAFDVNFGLASPLRDPANFSYDDPLLYQDSQMAATSAQMNEQQLQYANYKEPSTNNDARDWGAAQWNMPGTFRPEVPEDAMEVDSPSIAPSTYYDPAPAGYPMQSVNEAPGFPADLGYDKFQFAVTTANGSPTVEIGRDAYGMFPGDILAAKTPDFASFSYVSEDISPDSNHTGQTREHASLGLDSASAYRSASNFSAYDTPQGTDLGVSEMYSQLGLDFGEKDEKDDASHHTSISAAVNELSPLTTTTSFTPSATSLHSTQPSFFSAQQYFRSSLDQPHRASIDLYQRRRLSIESIGSAHVPTRSQRSLASYFHFRDRDRDRDRKSPMSRTSSPQTEWSPPAYAPPRHSIRSIFKTNNNIAGENESFQVENEDSGPNLPQLDESAEPDGQASKKGRRSKRNLFTRFKPSAKPQDSLESKQEFADDILRDEEMDWTEKYPDMPPKASSQTPLQSKGNSLHNVDSAGSNAEIAQGPDYAALFTGVRKRRNLVGMKTKKKPDVKVEANGAKSEPETEKAVLAACRSSAEYSADCASAGSVPHSSHSFTSRESTAQDQPASGPSAFANASKRILGSRLMKKKNIAKNDSSDVVEVDLQSLDLPENTEILTKPQLLNKTRGRKEDRAADMVDQSKIFVCGYCDRRFKRQEHLKRHFRSLHTTEKPYDCSICSKKFSRTDNLSQHLKVHKQEEEEAAALKAEE